MIQDALNMFATALAHGGSASVVDLKSTRAGTGRPIMVNINGHSLAGAIGVKVLHGDTAETATTELVEITISSALLNEGFSFALPQGIKRYVTLALVGATSDGTWTAGLGLDEGQTNM